MSMMYLTKRNAIMIVSVLACSVGVTACSSIKSRVSDNSLAYKKTTKLDPVQLPADSQTLAFTPLYQVPESAENTLKLQNAQHTRYQLPKPISTIK